MPHHLFMEEPTIFAYSYDGYSVKTETTTGEKDRKSKCKVEFENVNVSGNVSVMAIGNVSLKN